MKKEQLNKLEELVSKAKEKLFGTEIKFEEVETEDGTVLFYEGELAEGTEIFVVVEDERVLASEGTFVLNDGREVVVNAEGKVVSVSEVTPTEEGEEMDNEEEETFSQDQVNKMLEDLRNELTSKFEAEKKALIEEAKKSKDGFETALNEVETAFNEFKETLTEEKPKEVKTGFNLLDPKAKAIYNLVKKKRK